MPLQITQQDITTLRCDAIVCPTDPFFSGSGGTDHAIHAAAGSRLEAACASLPPLQCGDVAVTEGFDLDCRYIIHTRGPVWRGGSENESVLLRSCYFNALMKAAELGIDSIAFPLISAGTFGFPKDQVLSIAQEAIGDFLNLSSSDMQVYLCIYHKSDYTYAYQEELDYFILNSRWGQNSSSSIRWDEGDTIPPISTGSCSDAPADFSVDMQPPMMASTLASPANVDDREEAQVEQVRESAPRSAKPKPVAYYCELTPLQKLLLATKFKVVHRRKKRIDQNDSSLSLDQWIRMQDDSFAVMLLKLIDREGMTDVQCYKKANVSRRTFWKIVNDPDYRPSKPTVLAFAIALKLTLEETQQLLKTVGFTLSHSNTFDMIIEFYICKKEYNIHVINAALYQHDQICLGC